MTDKLAKLRSVLPNYPDDAFERLAGLAHPVTLPKDASLFAPGDSCKQAFILVSGVARVEVVSEAGREVILYRVEPGQTCLMTTACLSSDTNYSAYGITETEVEAVVLSKPDFLALIDRCPVFRQFILGSYGARFAEFMVFVEEMLLQRVDVRLARHLLQHRDNGGALKQTHQHIATELGSAREVISRVLKEFEHKGYVKLSRGKINVVNAGGLSGLG